MSLIVAKQVVGDISWKKIATVHRKRPVGSDDESSGQEPSESVDLDSGATSDSETDGDGLDDPVAGDDDSEEDVKVYDVIDEMANIKRINNKKSYKIKPLPGRVGLKLNSAIRYYSAVSQKFYAEKLQEMVDSLKKPKKKKKGEESDEEEQSKKKKEEEAKAAAAKKDDEDGSDDEEDDDDDDSQGSNKKKKEKEEKEKQKEEAKAAAVTQEKASTAQLQRVNTLALSDERKYETVIRKYFDLLAIKLPYTQKNPKKTRRKVRELVAAKALVAGKLKWINTVIGFLKKPTDRKSDKDADAILPILNQFPIRVNGQPLTDTEMRWVAKYCTYDRKEPGETVCAHGSGPTSSHGMFICLKGTLGV